MNATITERGQVSIPAKLRREMHLEPGQIVRWEQVSASECRLIIVPQTQADPGPVAALNFAKEHGLDEGRTNMWMAELRAGEN